MNAATATLLCAPLLVTSLASQRSTQRDDPSRVGPRVPLDVSVEGLGGSLRTPGAPGGAIRVEARRATPSSTPLDCLERIADQATSGCLTASSTPTFGLLVPYPGLDNAFVPPAFVGGGENNQATGPYSAVGGGRNNLAYGYTYHGVIGHATVGGGGENQGCAGGDPGAERRAGGTTRREGRRDRGATGGQRGAARAGRAARSAGAGLEGEGACQGDGPGFRFPSRRRRYGARAKSTTYLPRRLPFRHGSARR